MENAAAPAFGIIDNRFLARSLGLLNPPPPIVVQEERTVREVITLLKDHKIGGVIVVSPVGRTTGMFTERDVVTKISLSQIDLDDTVIRDVMTKNPQTATMTTTIAFALNMMSQGGYRHIPIVDDSEFPVGLISVKNLVDYICGSLTKDLFSV